MATESASVIGVQMSDFMKRRPEIKCSTLISTDGRFITSPVTS